MKKRTAQRIARLSRFLPNHPDLEAGMAAGHVSLDLVEVIADRYSAKYADAWAEAMPLIVELAETRRFEDLARDLAAFANNLAPKDAEERFEELIEGRQFRKTPSVDFEGYAMVRGFLDPIAYEIFAGEHDRLVDELFAEDWAFAREVLGRDPTAIELARAHPHRRPTLPRRPGRDGPTVHDPRRRLCVSGGRGRPALQPRGLRGSPAPQARRDPDDEMTVPPGGFCETDDGTPITPVAAVYASILGRVRRIVFDAEDEILSYGRARYPFTNIQKGALRAKFRRCTHPYGCDHTGRRLQIDHIIEAQHGGPTDTANGQPMDGPHNRWKTNHLHDPPPDPTTRIDTNQRRGPPPWW